MATATEPFVHHPELRDLIDEPENCFFRTFTTTKLAEMAREKGIPQWWYSDDEREAMPKTGDVDVGSVADMPHFIVNLHQLQSEW